LCWMCRQVQRSSHPGAAFTASRVGRKTGAGKSCRLTPGPASMPHQPRSRASGSDASPVRSFTKDICKNGCRVYFPDASEGSPRSCGSFTRQGITKNRCERAPEENEGSSCEHGESTSSRRPPTSGATGHCARHLIPLGSHTAHSGRRFDQEQALGCPRPVDRLTTDGDARDEVRAHVYDRRGSVGSHGTE